MKKKRNHKKSIVNKITVSNTLIMFFVFMISFISIISLSTEFFLSKEKKMTDSNLTNSLNSIDNKLVDMTRISLISFSDERIQDIIKNYKNYSYKEQLESAEYIQNIFLSLITIRNDINGIYIFDKESLIYRYDDLSAATKNFDLNKMFWLPEPEEQNSLMGNCKIMVGGVPEFISYTELVENNYIYMSRQVKSFSPHEKIGYILITSPLEVIKGTIEQDIGKDYSFVLVDDNGSILCESSEKNLGKQIDDIYPELAGLKGKNSEISRQSIDNRDYMVISKMSEYSGLTLIVKKPVESVFEDSIKYTKIVVVISCLAVIVSVIVTFTSMKRLLLPVKRLSDAMTNVQNGNIKVEIPIVSEDEIGILTEGFNEMMNTIDKLISDGYEKTIKLQNANIKQKETQLLYLRSQINPHFLYNTLDTIRIKAELNNDKEVAELSMMLVEFFRYSINSNFTNTILMNEIELVKIYMALMKKRYPKLEDEYDIDEELMDLMMPSFILQPLVENAILHGLKGMGYQGVISLSAKRSKEKKTDIVICISDNGIGMSEELINDVNHSLETLEPLEKHEFEKRSHIGIMNVQERLNMIYPSGYGLKFYKNTTQGVTVKILLDSNIEF